MENYEFHISIPKTENGGVGGEEGGAAGMFMLGLVGSTQCVSLTRKFSSILEELMS